MICKTMQLVETSGEKERGREREKERTHVGEKELL